MKGIVGRKLGMTQVFDDESGVVTSVTVIEAGPCPVVAVRTPDADGYEAVQLAYEPVADRKISKPERGHLAKNGVDGAYRHLVEFRGHFSDAVQGENVTVEIFQPGDKVKVAGIGIGKGFQGTIKRHRFHRGPRLARLAQHPQAGLDRRERDAVARVQGHEDGRPAWAASASRRPA